MQRKWSDILVQIKPAESLAPFGARPFAGTGIMNIFISIMGIPYLERRSLYWNVSRFWYIKGMGHDDAIKWKHFQRCWPVVLGIHRSPVNSPHKGQWCRALMFSLICTWVNNREAGYLRLYRAHHDVTVMPLYWLTPPATWWRRLGVKWLWRVVKKGFIDQVAKSECLNFFCNQWALLHTNSAYIIEPRLNRSINMSAMT